MAPFSGSTACALLPAALLFPRHSSADTCSYVKSANRGMQAAPQMLGGTQAKLTGVSLQKCQQMCCDSRLQPSNNLCNNFDYFNTGNPQTSGCYLRAMDPADMLTGLGSLAVNGFPADNYRLVRSSPKFNFVNDMICGEQTTVRNGGQYISRMNGRCDGCTGPTLTRVSPDWCKEECSNIADCKVVSWRAMKQGRGPPHGISECRFYTGDSSCSTAAGGTWTDFNQGHAWDMATYVLEDQAQVAGDPFTSFNGKNNQFYLPDSQPHLLLSCGPLELSGQVNGDPTRGGDHTGRQWLTSVHASFGGKEVVMVRSRDAPTRPRDADAAAVGVDVQPTEAKPLTTLRVDAGGDAMETTGSRSVAGGAINVTVEQDPDVPIGGGRMEIVRIAHSNPTTVIKSSLAGKFASPEEKLRNMHVDMNFESMNVKCLSGPLPEIWGVNKMTEATAKMLVPP